MDACNEQDSRAAQEALTRLAIKNLRFKRRTVPAPDPPPTQPAHDIQNQSSSDLPAPHTPHAPPPETGHAARGVRDSSPRTSPAPAPSTSPAARTPLLPPPENIAPPILRVNRYSRAPQVCSYRDGKVASRDFFDSMVITSPNMDYVPGYPVEKSIVHTYSDGLWGPHEYSRFPQPFARGRWHLACIPADPCPPDVPPVLWTHFNNKHWREDTSIGFSGLGYIDAELREDLASAANTAVRRFEECDIPENVRAYGKMLVVILRQVVDRMQHLPAVPSVAIAVAAHVERVALELAGLRTYAEVVLPRIESSADFSTQMLSVVGGFARDASDAALFTRVGIPTWFLQPLTHQLGVWRVVDSRPWWATVSRDENNPPIFQSLATVVGVGNLTGNWQQSMLLAVSKQVAGGHLASLSLAEVPEIPSEESSPMKRPRLQDDGEGAHLRMSPSTSAPSVPAPKKTRRGRNRGQAAAPDAPAASVGSSVSSSSPMSHPSKAYTPSAWYDDFSVWEQALRTASPVPRARTSALYFYPPPFLLDGVSSIAPLDPSAPYPGRARTDEKVHRYLHNFIRIRKFLCIRLFDPSLAHEPLTIAEWRAALWGDYTMRDYTVLPKPKGTPSDVRRIQRQQGERNDLRRLFSRVARLPSYREDEPVDWHGAPLRIEGVRDLFLRALFLWECHETNFRAELLALDALLVQKSTWQEIHRWERESIVTEVWGEPSTVLSVLPDDSAGSELRWASKFVADVPHTETVRTLRKFAKVLTRWPGCPEAVVRAGDGGPLEYSDFVQTQAQAVDFYPDLCITYANNEIRVGICRTKSFEGWSVSSFLAPSHLSPSFDMREKWRFTDAQLAWIEDKFHNDPEVARRMNDTSASARVFDAAVYLSALFQEEFPDPYPGETEKEFSARRANMSSKKARRKAQRIPPETPAQFEERMTELPQSIKQRLYTLRLTQKRDAPLPPLPALPAAKRYRSVTGFDLFQGSPEAPRAGRVLGDRQVDHDVGTARHLASVRWQEMTDEEKAPYMAQAVEENKRRLEEREATSSSEVSDDPHPAYTANQIATWAMAAMKTVDDQFKWAGAVVLAGPDEQGEIMTYVQNIGHNRHGETLMDSIYKSTGVDEPELKALALTFAEQAKQGPMMEPQALAQNVAARVLADIRAKKVGNTPTASNETSSDIAIPAPTPARAPLTAELPDSLDSNTVGDGDGDGFHFNGFTSYSPEPQGTPNAGLPSPPATAPKKPACKAAGVSQHGLDADASLAHGERFTQIDQQLMHALENMGAEADLPMPELFGDDEQVASSAPSTKRVCPEQSVRTKGNKRRARRAADTAGVMMPPEDAPYVLASHRESRTVKPTYKVYTNAENARAEAMEKQKERERKAAAKKRKNAAKKK